MKIESITQRPPDIVGTLEYLWAYAPTERPVNPMDVTYKAGTTPLLDSAEGVLFDGNPVYLEDDGRTFVHSDGEWVEVEVALEVTLKVKFPEGGSDV